jgi:lipopolysaccharide/colanic/teichoic acid biosynthesis glycosyltransferase
MYDTTPTSTSKLNRSITWLGDLIKRSFDITISVIVLVLLAPFFGVIALAIRRDSPGPAIYRGPRMGRGGRIFNILKFRTMYETVESYDGPKVTAKDDPRITQFGRWLRDTKLNEFPQFWNVLKGEMSLVGPRPEDADIAETWPEDVKEEVLSVRPGITSPASVQCRNEESLLSITNVMQTYMEEWGPDKIRLDQLYVRHRTFWLDLDILFLTALVLLPKLRSYSPPEKFLFLGPISRLTRRHLSWFTIDLMVTFVAIGLTGYLWRLSGPLDVGWPVAIGFALGFALLFSITGSILGVNRITWSKALDSEVLDLVPAGFLATLIALLVNHILGLFPLGLIFVASGLAFGGFVVVRYRTRLITGFLSRLMRRRNGAKATWERVIIVGIETTAQLMAWLLNHPTDAGNYNVVGFVDDDYDKQGMRIYGANILGNCEDIPQLVEKYDVGLIIFTAHQNCTNGHKSVLDICASTPARLVVIPDIHASLNGVTKLSHVDQQGSNLSEGEDLGGELHCYHCLLRYASLQIEAQSDELEKKTENGDLDEIQSYSQANH